LPDQTTDTVSTLVKSDTSLLFKRLNELNSVHRIIMTGVRDDLGALVLQPVKFLCRLP
jgi:hypothetical protein